jgi:hypothetical protein
VGLCSCVTKKFSLLPKRIQGPGCCGPLAGPLLVTRTTHSSSCSSLVLSSKTLNADSSTSRHHGPSLESGTKFHKRKSDRRREGKAGGAGVGRVGLGMDSFLFKNSLSSTVKY